MAPSRGYMVGDPRQWKRDKSVWPFSQWRAVKQCYVEEQDVPCDGELFVQLFQCFSVLLRVTACASRHARGMHHASNGPENCRHA